MGWDAKRNINVCEQPFSASNRYIKSLFRSFLPFYLKVHRSVSGAYEWKHTCPTDKTVTAKLFTALMASSNSAGILVRDQSQEIKNIKTDVFQARQCCVKKTCNQLRSQTYKNIQTLQLTLGLYICTIAACCSDALTKRHGHFVSGSVNRPGVPPVIELTQMAQCGFCYRRSYEVKKKQTPKHFVSCSPALCVLINFEHPSYLISVTLVSVGFVLAPDFSSSVSWTFLATFGLELAFLLIWGLCPLRCICGLLEPSFRLSSGLLEPFTLGCCRLSRVLSGMSPRSPQ